MLQSDVLPYCHRLPHPDKGLPYHYSMKRKEMELSKTISASCNAVYYIIKRPLFKQLSTDFLLICRCFPLPIIAYLPPVLQILYIYWEIFIVSAGSLLQNCAAQNSPGFGYTKCITAFSSFLVENSVENVETTAR